MVELATPVPTPYTPSPTPHQDKLVEEFNFLKLQA